MKIPLTLPYVGDEETKLVYKTIKSGWLVQGPRVKEFENLFSKYVGVKHSIAVNSCTSALHLSLLLSKVSGGEVIVPSLSFIATANAVVHAGAKPVFVDINPKTYNIDEFKIEEKINENTKAIMPVHQLGLPCNIGYINKIARKHNLAIIDDAACAIGSEYKGKKIGGFCDASCFSFHPRKILTTGEGGMVTTNNDKFAKAIGEMRSHGASIPDFARHKSKKAIIENYNVLGYNYRMNDMEASLGIIQMKKLEYVLKKRIELAKVYNEELSKINCIGVPFIPKYVTRHNYQSYIIKINKNVKYSRDKIMQMLLDKGIATRIGVMAIHMQNFYVKKFGKISLPNTETASKNTMIIPLFVTMTEEQQKYVINNIKSILK